MSIKSTKRITRETAESRILYIHALALVKNYREIDLYSFEADHSIQTFVDNYNAQVDNIENWTDRMLEDLMDQPFFRYSMFENYLIDFD